MKIWGLDEDINPKDRIDAIELFLRQVYGTTKFSYVDLCCGKGDVIKKLSKRFPNGLFLGVDIVDYGPDWKMSNNITFLNMDIQDFIQAYGPYDVCSMLNSYRNWPEEYRKLKEDLHIWLYKNVKFFITSLRKTDSKMPFPYTIIGKDSKNHPLILCRIKEDK
jgi:hypothetical protein